LECSDLPASPRIPPHRGYRGFPPRIAFLPASRIRRAEGRAQYGVPKNWQTSQKHSERRR
jgi:hypothetical protein